MKNLLKLGLLVTILLMVIVSLFANLYEVGKLSNLEPPTNTVIGIALLNAGIFLAFKIIIHLFIIYAVTLMGYKLYEDAIQDHKEIEELEKKIDEQMRGIFEAMEKRNSRVPKTPDFKVDKDTKASNDLQFDKRDGEV